MVGRYLWLNTGVLQVPFFVVSETFDKTSSQQACRSHCKNVVFFSDFQYGFKSSRSNCIFLFADCGFWFSTCLVPLELEDLICQIFSRGWHCGLANKRKCFGSYIRISGFISSFLSINRLRVISVVKFSEGYSFDVGVLRAPFLAVLFYINDLPVVCNIPIYV